MRVLVVGDDRRLAGFIKKGLKEQKYTVDVACDGINAEHLAMTNDYDFILLDVLLPGQDGWETCQHLRKSGLNTPIIILSSFDKVSYRIRALDNGADDYITTPFVFEELLARIRAILRRTRIPMQAVIRIDDLELDTAARKIYRGGKEIPLTGKEFALLELLIIHKNQVVTRSMITKHIWNSQSDVRSNVIDVFITYLRKKIETENSARLIHTIRGVGYILKEQE